MMPMIGENGSSVTLLNLIDLILAPDKSSTLVKSPTRRPSEKAILTMYMHNECGLEQVDKIEQLYQFLIEKL